MNIPNVVLNKRGRGRGGDGKRREEKIDKLNKTK